MTKQDFYDRAYRQHRHFKSKFPDVVLFFRLGDFYETFDADAQTCRQVLGVTLTVREEQQPNMLAGVPYQHINEYLKRMMQAGHCVALCEQAQFA